MWPHIVPFSADYLYVFFGRDHMRQTGGRVKFFRLTTKSCGSEAEATFIESLLTEPSKLLLSSVMKL